MARISLIICVVLLVSLELAASADTVIDWNNNTMDAIASAKLSPPEASRLLAMVHVAIFDAAVTAAAYTVLVNVVPQLNSKFYRERLNSLNQIPEGIAKRNGASWGVYVGSTIAFNRKGDVPNFHNNFKVVMSPGLWRPTPPAYTAAMAPYWAYLTPFCIAAPDAFDPGPPYPLSSVEYAQDVNEVKDLGELHSEDRTPDETQTAFFWDDPTGTISPAGRWNKVAQTISEKKHLTLPQNARLLALLNIALADSCIAAWETKYRYDLWRPITAIREANSAGNPLVEQDITWTPLLPTPPFPEYLPGHSTFPGAGAEVLKLFFGEDNIPFDLYSEVIGVTRSYSSFSEAADEDGMSRIYAGIHYSFSNTRGLKMGRDIGKYVFENELKPL